MATIEIKCRLVTPTAELLSEPITYASIPAWDGLMGVEVGHAPMVVELGTGELRLAFPRETHGGGDRSYFVSGGFAKIADNDLIILAEQAVPAESIAESDAKAELAEAEARTVPDDAPDKAAAADAIREAQHAARVKLRIATQRRTAGI